jgi:hypothetical protein
LIALPGDLALTVPPRLLAALVVEADEMSNNPDSSYKPEPLPIYAVDRTAHLH